MLMLLTLACGEIEDSATPTPTFTEIDGDILVLSCGLGSTCHEGGAGGLEIDGDGDYEAMVDVAATGSEGATLVVPGDSAGSYLIQKLQGDAGITGDPMPPPGGLDADKIALVAAWIDAGAPND
jgi:hypothetical protein